MANLVIPRANFVFRIDNLVYISLVVYVGREGIVLFDPKRNGNPKTKGTVKKDCVFV